MTRHRLNRLVLTCLVVGTLTASAAAQITITSDEIWDGVMNPRAGDGVTLSSGVYTIPDELVIGSGATLFLSTGRFEDGGVIPSDSITFDFTPGAGGLTFADATSTIDVHDGNRFGDQTYFTLNMFDNDIQGDGQIINGPVTVSQTGAPMSVAINSNANVALGAIDVSKKDARLGTIDIVAHGAVDIGRLSTSDVVDGGASAGAVLIRANSITVGDIDTRASRLDGNADNGNVTLAALAPPSFDASNAADNRAAENILTLTGAINANGPATTGPNVGGSVNLTAVKLVLESGFTLDIGENASSSLRAGVTGNGLAEGDLFMDMSGSGLSASFDVQHTVPEPAALLLAMGAAIALLPLRTRRTSRP